MASGLEDADRPGRDRRHLISQFLVAGLVAVALAEPEDPVRHALNTDGISIYSLALPVVYLLTALRFFLGNILHLHEDERTENDGRGAECRWLLDFSFVLFECVILIFLGAVTSIYRNARSAADFFELLKLLLIVDVIWLMTVGALHKVGGPWRRERIPWTWAVLNLALLAAIVVLPLGFHYVDDATSARLWPLVVINLIVFGLDMRILAHHLDRGTRADTR